MSWVEIKKSVNSDLDIPLNELIKNGVIGDYKLFKSSGSFIVPAGVKKILVSAIGGGGAGGGGGSVFSEDISVSSGYYFMCSATGGGGGAGEYVIDEPFVVTPGETIDITVGIANTGGTGGTAETNGANGRNGGDTVVGSLITLKGGTGGGGASYSYYDRSKSEQFIRADGGSGGNGGVSGEKGTAATFKGNNSTKPGVAYGGDGGVATEIFRGLYGYGGKGGGSVRTLVSGTWYKGSSGNNGKNGAVLICWGQFDHETVF